MKNLKLLTALLLISPLVINASDLLIKNGTIHIGDGSKAFVGDLYIKDGLIKSIGDLNITA